ncbi:MAG: hypothetical protein MJA83_15940, partial [Gammaproteobacteria bacterium]|nr:hypothetical protein [Gammaproteobacteria bacterium]
KLAVNQHCQQAPGAIRQNGFLVITWQLNFYMDFESADKRIFSLVSWTVRGRRWDSLRAACWFAERLQK